MNKKVSLKKQLSSWIRGCNRLVVLGVGNPMRGDDAAGVEVVKRLFGKVPEWTKIIDCEMTPENFLPEIEAYKPTHVLIVDAAEMNTEPGEVQLLSLEKMLNTAISTHTIPLSILAGVLAEEVKAKIVFLGIQPGDTSFTENMSPEVQKAVKEVAGTILEVAKEIK
ncbi:MAG: hydrogenase maturation peptidase HycI [Candidatus Bathyarchaeia archaeon]|nr:hydrogenase maturation peptidase HycI [Candidatus Bathyarchaeota archaeon]